MVFYLLYVLKNKMIMKTKKIMLICAVAASFAAMACDMYDDGIPSKTVRKEFKAMYPEAKDVEWEREGKNWSVSFEIGKHPDEVDYEALYDSNGGWIMTETDVLLVDVPVEIKNFLSSSQEYGNLPYADRDAEYYKTAAGDFYRIELNNNGREIEVDVTTSGKVLPARYDLF